MTECRVIVALWAFSMSLSWALQSAPKATERIEALTHQSRLAESQRQIDEAVRQDAANREH